MGYRSRPRQVYKRPAHAFYAEHLSSRLTQKLVVKGWLEADDVVRYEVWNIVFDEVALQPLFLQRTLTYMPKSSNIGPSSRERRENFKVDSLRDQVIARMRPTYGRLKLQIAGVQDYSSIQDRVELNMAVVRSNNSKNGHVSKVSETAVRRIKRDEEQLNLDCINRLAQK